MLALMSAGGGRVCCMMLCRGFDAMLQAQVMFQAAADLGDSNGLVGQGTMCDLCLCSRTFSDMKIVSSKFGVNNKSVSEQPQSLELLRVSISPVRLCAGYLEMQGDVPNVAAARRAYEAAAMMGNAEAHFNLGAIYGGMAPRHLGFHIRNSA